MTSRPTVGDQPPAAAFGRRHLEHLGRRDARSTSAWRLRGGSPAARKMADRPEISVPRDHSGPPRRRGRRMPCGTVPVELGRSEGRRARSRAGPIGKPSGAPSRTPQHLGPATSLSNDVKCGARPSAFGGRACELIRRLSDHRPHPSREWACNCAEISSSFPTGRCASNRRSATRLRRLGLIPCGVPPCNRAGRPARFALVDRQGTSSSAGSAAERRGGIRVVQTSFHVVGSEGRGSSAAPPASICFFGGQCADPAASQQRVGRAGQGGTATLFRA